MLMPVVVVVSAGMGVRVTHDPQHAGGTLLQHLDHSGTQATATTSLRPFRRRLMTPAAGGRRGLPHRQVSLGQPRSWSSCHRRRCRAVLAGVGPGLVLGEPGRTERSDVYRATARGGELAEAPSDGWAGLEPGAVAGGQRIEGPQPRRRPRVPGGNPTSASAPGPPSTVDAVLYLGIAPRERSRQDAAYSAGTVSSWSSGSARICDPSSASTSRPAP